MDREVREPIQVYLTQEERAELDRLAANLGVSRSELLRRGVRALDTRSGGTGPLRDLVTEGLVTPASLKGGRPPRGIPVAPLKDILRELKSDRADR